MQQGRRLSRHGWKFRSGGGDGVVLMGWCHREGEGEEGGGRTKRVRGYFSQVCRGQ